jgi:predicted dehydrogenase
MRPAFLLAAALLTPVALSFEAPVLRLIEVDPAHSHAAALHTKMLAGFSSEAHIYAPLGADLTAHIDRIARFNARAVNPTQWTLKIYAGPGFLQKMQEEPPGNVVVLSGRNAQKIDYILAALKSGQNVLADKPWIIEADDLPRLETALNLADEKGLVAYDCMTQRFDFAYRLQRTLVSDREVFGEPVAGTVDAPAVRMENLHALLKGGAQRPAWYFDIHQQGEGVADVGTHLADLVQWTLFADQSIDYRKDVRVLRASRWPTVLTAEQFRRVTGEKDWPAYLHGALKDGKLDYFTNNDAVYSIRGVNVFLRVKWEYEAAPGVKDSYFTSFQGSKARIELREGPDEHFIPEIYLIPVGSRSQLITTLKEKLPNFRFEEQGERIHVLISPADRGPGTDNFALLADRFLGYVRSPKSLPSWEKAGMIAKYYVTTRAVQLAREVHP